MVYQECRNISTLKNDVVDITEQVIAAIRDSGVQRGTVTVEADSCAVGCLRLRRNSLELTKDLTREMRRLVPARINFTQEISPEYTAGNLKYAFFGNCVTGIVRNGMLLNDLNGFFLMEYDGPATRSYHVCVIGE